YPARSLKTLHAYHTHHCITGIPFAGHSPFPLFISAMASQQDNQDFLAQETRFGKILLNLSKGQEELRTLIMETFVRNSAEDERLEHLQAEVDALKAQMLGQMTAIQGLTQRQDELGVLINKLLQGNQLGQTSKGKKPIIVPPPLRQRGKEKAPHMAPVSPIQQQLHQLQTDKPRRQFTPLNMSLFQALQRLLRLNLVTLRAQPQNLNTAHPAYDRNKRCAYHSACPGHNANECWALKNKIQDLIDEGALEFTQDGQAEFFYHPSKAHHLK
ncbi:unnamed protein product, partial [Vicia faba]